MYYEIDEAEEFEAAQRVLVRRSERWARGEGAVFDPFLAEALIGARHTSTDGRLGHWTTAEVHRILLEWVPRKVSAQAAELTETPATLATLLRYLDAAELLDPRGDTLPELLAAVDAATPEFGPAVSDPANYGLAKYWVMLAIDSGVDVRDGAAMDAFVQRVRSGQVRYDEDLVESLTFFHAEPVRTFPQPPIRLPDAGSLAAAARRSPVAGQICALVDWVGDGRSLTTTGRLRAGDKRELAAVVGADAPQELLLAWAKQARLVRVVKGRLVTVARSRKLLADPLALWDRLLETFAELRDVVITDRESPMWWLFDLTMPDVLNTLYGMEVPMPLVRLQESVCLGFEEGYQQVSAALRRRTEVELAHVFDILAELGAVEITHGVADQLYYQDLDLDEIPFPPETIRRLRVRMAEPGPQVVLTPLGLRAIRTRLLAEGREAGLVGELAHAPAAGMLGVVVSYYPPEAAAEEISGWLAVHDGDEAALWDAVGRCPLRGRAAAMLHMLAGALPGGELRLRRLRSHPLLAPLVLRELVESGVLDMSDLIEREGLLVGMEGFLQLLELSGPDDVIAQLSPLSATDRAGLLNTLLSADHPLTEAVAEFRDLVVAPLLAAPARPIRRRPPNRPHHRRR